MRYSIRKVPNKLMTDAQAIDVAYKTIEGYIMDEDIPDSLEILISELYWDEYNDTLETLRRCGQWATKRAFNAIKEDRNP